MRPERSTSGRLIVYGGTFDPVHLGHTEMAARTMEIFDASEVLFLPGCVPPHKRGQAVTDALHRYSMLALATLENERFRVDPIELESPERPYSYQTMERLAEKFGSETTLFFLMGADSFQDLPLWRELDRFLSTTNVIVTARPGGQMDSEHLTGRFGASVTTLREGERPQVGNEKRIYLTDCGQIEISAAAIRARIRDGQPIREFVAPAVETYIRRYGLYQS